MAHWLRNNWRITLFYKREYWVCIDALCYFWGASVDTVGMIEFALPCVTYFVFAFIGLFLPGLMLKK